MTILLCSLLCSRLSIKRLTFVKAYGIDHKNDNNVNKSTQIGSVRWLFSVHVLRWKFWTVGTSVFICDFSEQFAPEYHIIKYIVLCWLYSNYNVYYVQKQTSCVLILYKDFCVFLTHKTHNKIPKISDSKIIIFYTNTTPHFADFAKKSSAN